MKAEPNTYSDRWFELFHAGISETRTNQETAFICACAPLPYFRRVADVCCGTGRHARALAAEGYIVTGVERDSKASATARELGGDPSYLQADLRDYRPEPGAFDLVIIMSQSFGYFDAGMNRDILSRLAIGLRPCGRVILDLWNRDLFVAHQGGHEFELSGVVVRENKRVDNDRLFVELEYPDRMLERFEWQLFSPTEMTNLAQSVSLALSFSCTDFDAAIPPSPEKSRIQFLLERS